MNGRLITADDVNKFACEAEKWPGVTGTLGIRKCNSNGEFVLAFSSECRFVIADTVFKHKQHHKTIWAHLRSKHWHLLDEITIRQEDMKDIMDPRAVRGTYCSSNHTVIPSKFAFAPRKVSRKSKPKHQS